MDDDRKQALIEQHRYDAVEWDGWWDCVYADFKQDMVDIGLAVDTIQFSGFCRQGDGACFNGYICNWALFLPTIGYTDPALLALAREAWSSDIRHTGRYCHEHSAVFALDLTNPDELDDAGFIEWHSPYKSELQSRAWVALLKRYDYAKIQSDIEEACRGHMRTLYKRLEEEHDWLTSDECVWEMVLVNGLHKEEECDEY